MLFFLTGPVKFRHWFIGEGTPLARITDGLPLAAQVVCERTTLFVKEINHKLVRMCTCTFCTHTHTENCIVFATTGHARFEHARFEHARVLNNKMRAIHGFGIC